MAVIRRARSKIEILAEKLMARTRVTCATMPQKWSARQIEVLEVVVEHGRKLNYASLANMLDVGVPGFYYLIGPLLEGGYVEKVPTGLLVTRKGAEVIAKVRNAERAIEECILANLDPEERRKLFQLLEKAVEDPGVDQDVSSDPAPSPVIAARRA